MPRFGGMGTAFGRMGAGGKVPASAAAAAATAASNFLARTSGLDATHQTAYTTLLDGLTTDGFFDATGTPLKLDALYIFATADSTTALLNLCQNLYNATVVNAPTFAADAGYTGNGTTSYVNTNFNPTTAVAPFYTRNSASAFAWCNTSAAQAASIFGYVAGSSSVYLYPRNTDNRIYFGPQDDGAYGTSVGTADGKAFVAANRSTSGAVQGYKTGASVVTATPTSSALVNSNFAFGLGDAGPTFSSQQFMAGGFGASLSGTEHANLYARIHAFLQTIAGIA